jgi:hypothetical protein
MTNGARVRGWIRHALRQHPGKVAAALGLISTLLPLAALETGLRLERAWGAASGTAPAQAVQTNFDRYVELDPRLGYRPVPVAQTIHDVARRGEEVIYEAVYHLDASGRRVIPGANLDADAPVLGVMGCSFAFGLGLADEEALGARLAAYVPEVRPINLAVPGYGTQHVWLQLHQPAVVEALRGRRGVLLYVFIDHHLDRLVGRRNLDRGWLVSLPWLDMEEGAVVHRGTFGLRTRAEEVVPWLHARSLLFRSVVSRVRQFGARSVVEEHAAMHALFGGVMRESAARLAEIAPEMAFRVVMFPYTTVEPWVTARLDDVGVAYWDHSALPSEGHGTGALWYPDGPGGKPGHPRALLIDMLAARMMGEVRAVLHREAGVAGN